MESTGKSGPTAPRSVTGRALSIIDLFTTNQRELRLKDISTLSNLPPATAHRLCAELVEWGALERLPDGTYRIGARLWEVGLLAPSRYDLREIALPHMQELYDATKENVHLAVLDSKEALYVEKINGRRSVPIVSHVGARLPLHATSVGKVLLAHSPADFQREILTRPLRAYTPYTLVMPGQLQQTLTIIRRKGFAMCIEEMTLGSVSVAAPVFQGRGDLVAALSVVVHSNRPDHRRLAPLVRRVAAALSSELTGAGVAA